MPPTAVLSLASFMKREGHEVRIYERTIDSKSILQTLKEFEPDVVVCTLMFLQQIPDMQTCCQKIRALYPDVPILCGGLTASFMPESILLEGLADYVGIGEGEYTLLELIEVVNGLREPASVQSLVYLDLNGQPVHTAQRPFADLSDFPDTDFSLLPMGKYFVYYPVAPHTLTAIASKGCPYKCTFCFNAAYHHCQYRSRTRESVMREIETLVSEYGADGFVFIDELWGFDKNELRGYCKDIAALSMKLKKPIRWFCETRIGVLTLDDMKHMVDAGCWGIIYGLESGSPEILERIKKGYPLSKIETDVNNCKVVGLESWLNIIFGFPGETSAQIKQTVHTIFRLNPTIYGSGLFCALPGTAEYNDLVLSGKLHPPKSLADWPKQTTRQFFERNYSAISDRELKVIHYFFFLRLLFQNRKDQRTDRLQFIKLGLWRVIDSIGQKGFFEFLGTVVRTFLYVVWYNFAFPKIRKKYDLYGRNFGRKDWDDLKHLDIE